MEVTWLLDEGTKTFTVTQNTFETLFKELEKASESSLVRLNDARFDGGRLFCYRKSLIKGVICPELAVMKLREVSE